MIIPINITTSSFSRLLPPQFAQFGTDEVVLIEMQGALDVEGNSDGQFVGEMTIDNATKKATLLIGHHLLEGKLVNLPKPLAVMHCNTRSSADAAEDLGEQDSQFTDGSSNPPSWDIVAVVKRKMVFAKRPMPIVGRPSATEPPEQPTMHLQSLP